MAPRRHELTEEQWERIKNLLPPEIGELGPRRKPNRLMLNAMFWVLHTGAPWRDLPSCYPKWTTVHTRFLRWSKRGVWKRVLDELGLDVDGEFAMLDATLVRVHQDAIGGKKTVASPSDGPVEDPPQRFTLSWTVSATQRRSSSQKVRSTT